MLRAQTEYSVKADDLRGYVLKQDKSRANYYNYFTGGKWGVCQNYELVVSSALGAQTVVDMIALACERREAQRHEVVRRAIRRAGGPYRRRRACVQEPRGCRSG